MGAFTAVDTTEKGRGLVTAVNLPEGAELLSEGPLLLTVAIEAVNEVCAECLKRLPTPGPPHDSRIVLIKLELMSSVRGAAQCQMYSRHHMLQRGVTSHASTDVSNLSMNDVQELTHGDNVQGICSALRRSRRASAATRAHAPQRPPLAASLSHCDAH